MREVEYWEKYGVHTKDYDEVTEKELIRARTIKGSKPPFYRIMEELRRVIESVRE